MTQSPHALLRDRVASHFLPTPPERLGVAVSGGSDSLAVLKLLQDWSQMGGPRIFAATVDHGLRPEAAAEAAEVARLCEQMGVFHDTLCWRGWDGSGNLQDQARRARYELLAAWAAGRKISHVALGHTADDQAETFLMRLAREAGVDGLSAMSGSRRQSRIVFSRPALRSTREELREVLRREGIQWMDDPSNEDATFERVRARQVLEALAPLGISATTLSAVSHHMAQVRGTLYWYVFLAAREMVTFRAGDILIERKAFRVLQPEVARRLVQSCLMWISSADYGPRGRALDLLMESIRGGTDMTLQGCRIMITCERIEITRELNAVVDLTVPVCRIWDNRWQVDGPVSDGTTRIAALGQEGLRQCGNWRDFGLPEASQIAGPAVWRGKELLAAPLAGLDNGWSASLIRDDEEFFAALLSQ